MTNGTEQLSEHFQARELWCRHCCVLKVAPGLLPALEALRAELCRAHGRDVPITVNSGYRCPTHNRRIGGSPNSKHLRGEAADIWAKGVTLRELYEAALQVPAFAKGGIGVYPQNGFIHIDVANQRRWGWVDGREVSLDSALRMLP